MSVSVHLFEAISANVDNLTSVPDYKAMQKREALETPQSDMPVVFLPQKSKTECERVSRMSSWGFMSFVLAVINGVINISNNINSNNNKYSNRRILIYSPLYVTLRTLQPK